MTDFEYDEPVRADHVPRGAVVVSLVNWAGALISVLLIVGLGLWGYKLWVRDVSGVPVVRALEGPMRIAPADPGGVAAEHQGLAVNRIASEGEAAPPADRLVLAPRPVTLADEDQSPAEQQAEQQQEAVAQLAAAEEAEAVEAAGAIDRAIAEALGSVAEAGEPMASDVESIVTASVEATDDEPGTPLALVETPEPQPEAVAAPEAADPESGAGMARSPRPMAKPQNVALIQASESAVTADAVGTYDVVDPATIPVGTRLAQLGAFDSVGVAEAEWTTLSEQFEDVMGGKGRVIQEAASGGKTFYRLRVAGFEDINDARRFCSVLLAAGASCIPVITR